MSLVLKTRLLAAVAIALSSFNSFAELNVTNAKVRLLPPGVPNTSAYFTIENTGTLDRYLVAANAGFASSAELHAHIMEGEVMRMQEQKQIVIPAGESVTFKPGGLHVMIFGLSETLSENQTVQLTLITKNKQSLNVDAKVVMPGDERNHHHHH